MNPTKSCLIKRLASFRDIKSEHAGPYFAVEFYGRNIDTSEITYEINLYTTKRSINSLTQYLYNIECDRVYISSLDIEAPWINTDILFEKISDQLLIENILPICSACVHYNEYKLTGKCNESFIQQIKSDEKM